MDHGLARSYLDRGILPHIASLGAGGTGLRPLGTTIPCSSPVAWSTFISGKNPGKHGIFDFLGRDPETYLPELALARLSRNFLGLPKIESRREGGAFWDVLGRHGYSTTLLWLPVTFPPPKGLRGKSIAGLGTPDLRGTWGSYTVFTTAREVPEETMMGGTLVPVRFSSGTATGALQGPRQTQADVRFTTHAVACRPGVKISLCGREEWVPEGAWSPWFPVRFRVFGPFSAHGLVRFFVGDACGRLSVYASPINLHPAHPLFPLSSPPRWSRELFERDGPYKTLGWSLDTWALEEGFLSEETFLGDQAETLGHRRKVLLDELRRADADVLVAVLQDVDLIQHVFWRCLGNGSSSGDGTGRDAIPGIYRAIDDLVGEVLAELGPDDTFVLLSDHGFGTFTRGVHINTWLSRSGHVTPVRTTAEGPRLSDISPGRCPDLAMDWRATEAYSLGLGNIWLNLKGREAGGIVEPGREYRVKRDAIAEQLLALRDPETDSPVVRNVYYREKVYSGPHVERAPDLLIGFDEGYRCSWETALGGIMPEVFAANDGKWQGDHCSRDPAFTPGVLASSRPLRGEDPAIVDLAPTILSAMGCPVPPDYDGQSLWEK